MKSELRDIISKETGRLKQDLVQQQLIKGEAHLSNSSFRNASSSPLDKYMETSCEPNPSRNPRTELSFLPVQATVAHHFADAEHMLKDIQHQRNNLESNLKAVERKRVEKGFYHLLDTVPFNSEYDGMLKIRRDVDIKIEEITSTLQREIEQDSRRTLEDVSVLPKNKSWGIKTCLPHRSKGHHNLPSGLSGVGTKALGKKTGKENFPEKGAAKKIKAATHKTSAHMKKSFKPGLAQKQDYLSSVYGRSPYQAVRITSKAPYLRYQSPVNPKTAAVMTGLLVGGNRVAIKEVPLQDLTSVPRQETTKPRKCMTAAVKTKLTSQNEPAKHEGNAQYFFQPTVDLSQIGTGEKIATVAVPLEGQLVRMAVPLGKPKTDLTQRLPVASDVLQEEKGTQAEVSSSCGIQLPAVSARSAPVVPASETSPFSNVAVITLFDKELGNQTHSKEKKQRKSLAQENKKKRSLAVQVLPTVDIDSVSESSYSSTMLPHIDDIPEPGARPQDTDYQEFRNYVTVADIETVEQTEDVDDSVDGLPTPQNFLTLEGYSGIQGHPYTGPPFPPEHSSMTPHPTEPGSVEADFRQAVALEERALEWIERELLALIVSEVNEPMPDPTSFTRTQGTPESSPLSESEDEDADRLTATIGLSGIQLFIDAGLPVDRDLVSGLIREVIEEKITTVLGHPKPTARLVSSVRQTLDKESQFAIPSPKETPLSTPAPSPEYTPPESEESAQQLTVLSTPERTPTTAVTSDESLSSEPNEKNQNQQDNADDQAQTPVVTPVPTPPGAPSSPVSVATPEPSIREPESSSQSAVVPTPPSSAAVKVPSPESEPAPEAEPVMESDVTEEPIQQKEPSEGDKTRSPTKLVQPLVSSPSSMTTSTLSTVGTTTVTTEEELSEGELIQPLVHAGKYSEGEFAISPDIIQLAVERRLPVGGDWDSTMMGKDEESRNELVRVALNGILQHGGDERRRLEDGESSSSSSSESHDQISTASTLRDTDDIKQDSIADITQSEGEVRLQDPMTVLLTHIQRHLRSPGNTVSEGELVPEHLRTPYQRQTSFADIPRTVTAAGNVSPGEVVWKRPGGIPHSAPAEAVLESGDQAAAVSQSDMPADVSVEEEHSHHDRSLHASDLFPGTVGTDSSFNRVHQSLAKPKMIHVEEQDSNRNQSDSNSKKTYSLDNHVRWTSPTILANETEGKVPVISVSSSGRDRIDNSEIVKETSRYPEPTQIQVTLPSVNDIQDTSEESQVLADIEQDTFGDVSSISGGDF